MSPPSRWPDGPGEWVRLAAFALAQFGLARLGLALTPGPGNYAAFWPASGLALGVLLVAEPRRWASYLAAGSLPIAAFNLLSGQPPQLVIAFAAANLLEQLAGAWLVVRLCGGRPRLASVGSLGILVLAGPVAATGIANLVPSAVLAGPATGASDIWLRLWLGSALGTLAVSPLVLAFSEPRPRTRLRPARVLELLSLAAALALASWIVFLAPTPGPVFGPALFPPLLVWATLRFGPRGATLAGLALTLVALLGTVSGRGFFAGSPSPVENVLAAQAFSALALLSVLAMAGVVESYRVAAEALRISERELLLVRLATDAAHDTLTCIGADGRLVYANEAASRLLGKGARDLVGKPVWEAFGEGGTEEWARHWGEVRRWGTVTVERTAVGPAGEAIPIEVRSTHLSFDGQEYAVCAGRDLRERRQAEAALRMASVGTLAAGVAHEINNPLAYVLGNLEFAVDEMARRGAGPGGSDRALAAIEPVLAEALEGSTRIRGIVRDLRVFSRADEEGGPAVADVGRALHAALALARHEIRHRARMVLEAEGEPRVAGSEQRLGQVFLNLLVNAAQAIPEGRAAENMIRVSTRAQGGEVLVEVEDTGCGMAPGVLAHVFEPFFTTKPVGSGTGLGLSICHGIVASLGGRIEVSSRPGRGSLFRVRLPAAEPEAEPAGSAPVTSRERLPLRDRGRVLVVDDDPLVGRVVERVLSAHEVVACTSPGAALLRAAGERFDLVLCDLMMPEMNGIEFQARLRREHPRLAAELIFLTGGAFTPGARAFLAETENLHLEKPFDAERLRAEVARRLAGAGASDRPRR